VAQKCRTRQPYGWAAAKRNQQDSESDIVYKVEANGVFVQIPRQAIAKLQKRYFFYLWDEDRSVVRWMCSFDTTERDVKEFASYVERAVGHRAPDPNNLAKRTPKG